MVRTLYGCCLHGSERWGDLCLLTDQSQGVLSSDPVLSAVPVTYIRESVSELNLYIIFFICNDEEISPLYSKI